MEPDAGSMRLRSMGDSGDIAEFLADHDGVITSEQAVRLGLSLGQIRWRVKCGEWLVLANGLYRSASHPMSEALLVRSAMLAHRGVADRTTAAWWHGISDELPHVLTLSVKQRVRADRLPLVDVDAVRREFDPVDLVTVRGLLVTALPMTVLLAAAWRDDGAAFMDRSLQCKTVTVSELVRAVGRLEGRKGVPRARELVALAAGDSESVAERIFVRLLHDAGVTGWVQQYWFHHWRYDFGWPDLGVVVEIHGSAYHRMQDRFHTDMVKANAIADAGWRELQYGWHELTDSPEDCIAEVCAMLARRQAEKDALNW